MLTRRMIVAATVALMALPAMAAAQQGSPLMPDEDGRIAPRKVAQQKKEPERPVRSKPAKPEKAGPATPSAATIERKLEAAPRARIRPEDRVTIREFKKRPDLRRQAPSIDIQSINFAFGSAEIPYSQFGKIENIATAMRRILRRDRGELFLIEGHTDAVGSWGSNLRLSEARAASLKRVLVGEFGIPSRALDTVGYGEEYLLVQTQYENWQNRRVTLRRVTDAVRPF